MDDHTLLAQLSERLDRLEAENERLRQRLEAAEAADDRADDSAPTVVSRRTWLARGATLAAGAVVGGAVLSTQRAAALNGAVLMDNNNAATNSTTIHANRGTDLFDSVFGATNDNLTQGTGLFGYGATFGVAGHSAYGTGVWGKASGHPNPGGYAGFGVQGYIDDDTSPGSVGVQGEADGSSQIGVRGVSTAGVGVKGQTTSGTGVYGSSTDGTGVEGGSTSRWGGWFHSGWEDVVLGDSNRTSPTLDSGKHDFGALVAQNNSDLATSTLWFAVKSGDPGTWRRLAGPNTTGALTLLTTPKRVYDSRPGSLPAVGLKAVLISGVDRVVDCTLASSGVPSDAVAVLLNVAVVAGAVAGYLSVRANGTLVPVPAVASINFAASQVIANSVTSACGAGATIALRVVGGSSNVIVDVVGYYR